MRRGQRRLAIGFALVAVAALALGIWYVRGRDEPSRRGTTTSTSTSTTQLSARQTIAGLLTLDFQFQGYLSLAQGSEVLERLASEGPYTAFLPNTDAWQAAGVVGEDGKPVERLADPAVLERHVVKGVVSLEDLIELDGDSVTALDGTRLAVQVEDSIVTVGGVPLVKRNITASNGMIHVLGRVIDETADSSTG